MLCRCHDQGPVCGEESVCGAAVYGRAQPVTLDEELEAGLLRPCEVEKDGWRQAVARRPSAGVAPWRPSGCSASVAFFQSDAADQQHV
jgi:hypothetical protein